MILVTPHTRTLVGAGQAGCYHSNSISSRAPTWSSLFMSSLASNVAEKVLSIWFTTILCSSITGAIYVFFIIVRINFYFLFLILPHFTTTLRPFTMYSPFVGCATRCPARL